MKYNSSQTASRLTKTDVQKFISGSDCHKQARTQDFEKEGYICRGIANQLMSASYYTISFVIYNIRFFIHCIEQ